MIEYRAYIITEDGQFGKAVDFHCRDDDAAKERAQKLVDGHDLELWQLGRKVATFKRKPG